MMWVHGTLVVLSAIIIVEDCFASRCLINYPEVNPKRYLHFREQMLPIRLETSRRITHQIVTNIFHIYLEEALGYNDVRIMVKDDHFSRSEAVARLAEPLGEVKDIVPKTMVNLEVWFPPEVNIIPWEQSAQIKDYGIIAPPGRFGWFIPTNLSYISKNMDHWRIFASPETAKYFAFTESEMDTIKQHTKSSTTSKYYCEESFCKNGMYVPDRCLENTCALLLAGYADISGFVEEHISTLQLYVKVAWVGPHLRSIVSSFTKMLSIYKDRSLVLLSWIPGAIVKPVDPDYRTVIFPPCEQFVNNTGCKYDLHRLVKLAWSKFSLIAGPVDEALTKMEFLQVEYKNLIERFHQAQDHSNHVITEDQSVIVRQVACDWLRDNKRTWQYWLPHIDDRHELHIGGIFPLTGSSYTAKSIVIAATMAQDAINRNNTVLRDYKLNLLVHDGQCQADVVLKTFINYIILQYYQKLVGILGPACSDTVEPLAGVSRHFRTIVISYSAEGSSFSDRKKYPYFFRTIGENNQYQHVYLQLLKKLGWKRLAAMSEDGQKYTEYLSHLNTLLRDNNVLFVSNQKFPSNREKGAMEHYLKEMKQKNVRIIIGDIYDDAARDVMCQAYRLEMTAYHSYVWFLPAWLSSDWYDTDLYNLKRNESVPCTTAQMIKAINGYFSLTHAAYASPNSIMQENVTVSHWKEEFARQCRNRTDTLSDYAGYAYDAVWMYALALDKLSKENASAISDIHSVNNTKRLMQILEATDFNGVSGRIQFRGSPSRVSVVHVTQWYKNQLQTVGTFEPNVSPSDTDPLAGMLYLNISLIKWLTPDSSKPTDGTPECQIFGGLAEFLEVTCEVIIINVVAFLLLVMFLLIGFIIVKRRYDKKVLITREYMKSWGIDLLNPASIATLDKWEIPRDRVVINRKLGEGAFGFVYGGEAYFNEKGWVAIAVKTLKVGSTTEEKLDFLSEAEVMKRFDHKNIVKLLGVCTKNEPVYTVMEFMLYGDLKTYLLARRHLVNERLGQESDEVSSKRLTCMALDIARALSYLAELKYVHRDVACRNCMVNASRVVKLGDFGMTRPMFENDYYKFNRKGMLPVRWMAPESLALGVFTPSSDVWSFGVVLYEIITFGSFPFQGMTNVQVLEHVKVGNTLNIPSGAKPQLEGLIRSCWTVDYKKRPQASEIVEFIANNPWLLTPCLDVPLSSVQIEDTGQFDILPEKLRKFSMSLRNRNSIIRSQNQNCASTQWVMKPTERGTPAVWSQNSCTPDSPAKFLPTLNEETRNERSPPDACIEPLLTNSTAGQPSAGKYIMLQPMKQPQGNLISLDSYATHDTTGDDFLL